MVFNYPIRSELVTSFALMVLRETPVRLLPGVIATDRLLVSVTQTIAPLVKHSSQLDALPAFSAFRSVSGRDAHYLLGAR